ncbi:MAG: phosphatase PAP2 family protein [Ruminococcus sp.]|nr:phosphatase PAP2 family protein [Ruminococcus sp.]
MLQALASLDGDILLWIQENIRTPLFDSFFLFITSLGDYGMIWIAASLLLMIPKKTRKVGFMCGLALIFSLLINNVLLKNIVKRARPFSVIDGLTSLKTPGDFSFPSGHTGASFAAAFTIYRMLPKKYGIPAAVLAVLIAFSRLYLGVHYPTDIIGGIITGVISSYLAQWIVQKLYSKFGVHEESINKT